MHTFLGLEVEANHRHCEQERRVRAVTEEALADEIDEWEQRPLRHALMRASSVLVGLASFLDAPAPRPSFRAPPQILS